MNLGDLVEKVRFLIAEPSTRRFSQADMARRASDAQRSLVLELDFPEDQMRLVAVSGTREYQLPALIKILRTYMLGPDGSQTVIYGTDIPTIEGEIQMTYDNSSGTRLGAPPQTPQWLVQPAEQYPLVNQPIGGRVPTKNQFTPCSRPAYYMRGGYIGFTIPPLNAGSTIIIDYIPSPPDLVNNSDVTLFPDLAKDAIVWKMVEDIMYSDNSSGAQEANAKFREQLVILNQWKFTMQANRPKMLVPNTARIGMRRRYYR
jgi:hypothetical protein